MCKRYASLEMTQRLCVGSRCLNGLKPQPAEYTIASWNLDVVCLLNVPASRKVYLRDGSAQTVVGAATLRQTLPVSLLVA